MTDKADAKTKAEVKKAWLIANTTNDIIAAVEDLNRLDAIEAIVQALAHMVAGSAALGTEVDVEKVHKRLDELIEIRRDREEEAGNDDF
jgi:hypothetical protein